MFQRLKQHFTPATFISLIALIFAVSGVSYAATGGAGKGSNNNSLTAHASKSKRGPRGPQGPAGPAGPAGKEGKAGPQGPAGAKGETGATGANGSNGAAGAGVTTATFKTEKGGCKEGGVELLSASPTAYVCNGEESTPGQPGAKGEQGIQGIQGIPGANGESVKTAGFEGTHEPPGISPCEGRGGTEIESEPAKGKVKSYVCNGKNGKGGGGGGGGLPKTLGESGESETETGAWLLTATAEEFNDGIKASTAVSFPIPLSAGLNKEHVFFVENAGEDPTECPGTAASPMAASGDLCVYSLGALTNPVVSGHPIQVPSAGFNTPGAGTTGALIYLEPIAAEVGTVYGTWAVAAE
jgi:Collagen triple helix repeat (20 copies)